MAHLKSEPSNDLKSKETFNEKYRKVTFVVGVIINLHTVEYLLMFILKCLQNFQKKIELLLL